MFELCHSQYTRIFNKRQSLLKKTRKTELEAKYCRQPNKP